MYFTVYTIVFTAPFIYCINNRNNLFTDFFLMESSHQGENIYVNEMVKKAQHFPVSGPL